MHEEPSKIPDNIIKTLEARLIAMEGNIRNFADSGIKAVNEHVAKFATQTRTTNDLLAKIDKIEQTLQSINTKIDQLTTNTQSSNALVGQTQSTQRAPNYLNKLGHPSQTQSTQRAYNYLNKLGHPIGIAAIGILSVFFLR